MSFSNVVGGKLKLKGKALDVKGGGVKKKKSKKSVESVEQKDLLLEDQPKAEESTGEGEDNRDPELRSEESASALALGRRLDDEAEQRGKEGGHSQQTPTYEDHRTPAEKVYDEQRTKLEMKRLARVASKSHRQKIEEFNQYLANLSEHYDIPKVGPG